MLVNIEFDWNETAQENFGKYGNEKGLIAQEVEKVFPELVYEKKDFKAIHYQQFTPLLIQAIKELRNENNELKDRLTALEHSQT